jgi:hypothetical protein
VIREECIACETLTIPVTTYAVEGEAGQHQRWPGPGLITVRILICAIRIDWAELPAVVATASAASYGPASVPRRTDQWPCWTSLSTRWSFWASCGAHRP